MVLDKLLVRRRIGGNMQMRAKDESAKPRRD